MKLPNKIRFDLSATIPVPEKERAVEYTATELEEVGATILEELRDADATITVAKIVDADTERVLWDANAKSE